MASAHMKNVSRLSSVYFLFSKRYNYLCLNSFLHTSTSLNVKGLPIKMPSLSPTMMEGTIVKWVKKEGESIQPGDILCDIQTDKAVVAFETEEEGTLAKILVNEDSKEIKIGTIIGLMVQEGEDWQAVEMPEGEPAPSASEGATIVVDPQKETSSIPKQDEHYGPSVRLLLEKYGLSADQVTADGPHGILVKGDVLRLIKERNLQPPPLKTIPPPSVPVPSVTTAAPQPPKPSVAAKVSTGDAYDDIEVTNMRRTIAKRLLQSKSTIAHTYSTLDCSIDSLLKLRKQFKAEGFSVSVNDLIIKAAATALGRCPQVNCVWEGNQLVQKSEIDISVAVATDAGLITPIVKGVDRKGLEDISETVRDLAGRAKENKLKLDEFQGGTFTISNLGMFGIKEFTAIINPPQCAILAVGGGRLELDEDGKPETRMNATLSYDQAAIADDTAAQFMEILKEVLEDPQLILLGYFEKKIDHPLSALL